MTVDAKRSPPIHQRKFEIGGRAGKSLLTGVAVIGGSVITVPQWFAASVSGTRPRTWTSETITVAPSSAVTRLLASAGFLRLVRHAVVNFRDPVAPLAGLPWR